MGEREREREGEERGVYLGSEGGVEVKLIEVVSDTLQELWESEVLRLLRTHTVRIIPRVAAELDESPHNLIQSGRGHSAHRAVIQTLVKDQPKTERTHTGKPLGEGDRSLVCFSVVIPTDLVKVVYNNLQSQRTACCKQRFFECSCC